MTNDEAKFILSAYRPGGKDANDPAFAEALAQAQRDPALAAWWSREQAHGNLVAAKLREIAPPAGLRDAIVTGGRMSGKATADRPRWWSRPWMMASAAAVAVLLVSAALWWRQADGNLADSLTKFALTDMTEGRHGSHGASVSALQARLTDTSMRLGAGVPLDFAALRDSGCRTINLGGREVLEVCFMREGTKFHLYVARRSDFPAPATVSNDSAGRFQAASWTDAAHRFVLVGDAGFEALRRVL